MTKPFAQLIGPILGLPRLTKRLAVMSVDVALCVLTVWLAYFLRLGEFVPLSGQELVAVFVAVVVAIPLFVISGLYRAIFRYSGWPALVAVARATVIYGVIYAAVFTAVGVAGVPRTVGIIQPILLLMFVGASRAMARVWLGDQYQSILNDSARKKVLIYGAGKTGRQLVAAISNAPEMRVAGFLDDDERLHGHVLNGQPIYNPADLGDLAATLGVRDVLLAMPNIARRRRNEILAQMRAARVSVRTLPRVSDLASGKVTASDLQDLDIDDLLGRDPVAANHILLAKNIQSKVVLVTGAGGSIGSELCRQILAEKPARLLLIEQSEHALYLLHQELLHRAPEAEQCLVPLLASVQDRDRLNDIFSTWRPSIVYHAAAYKHVPLVEQNPAEGVKNNIFGTLTVCQAAIEHEVAHFVQISTDKAVRPTNIMGASKRLAEMVLQALAETQSKTKFSMVRFGNVLGSSGSVVPKFRQQIRDGGPITLTHPEITRFFMTIPEAAQLVIQAGAMANGGDVFVLDMGQPVRIIDLAQRMIELSGLTLRDAAHPEGDIAIEITGLRPAEKLYEELLIGNDPKPTQHPRIMRAAEDFLPWAQLEPMLNTLAMAVGVNDVDVIRQTLEKVVSGYVPSADIVDWVYVEQGIDLRLPH